MDCYVKQMKLFEHVHNLGEAEINSTNNLNCKDPVEEYSDPLLHETGIQAEQQEAQSSSANATTNISKLQNIFTVALSFLRERYFDDKVDAALGYTLKDILKGISSSYPNGLKLSRKDKKWLNNALSQHPRVTVSFGAFAFRAFFPVNTADELLCYLKKRESIGIHGASLQDLENDVPHIYLLLEELGSKVIVSNRSSDNQPSVFLTNNTVDPPACPAVDKMMALAAELEYNETKNGNLCGGHSSYSMIWNEAADTIDRLKSKQKKF